jgi:hypothetical protein
MGQLFGPAIDDPGRIYIDFMNIQINQAKEINSD